MRIQKAYLFAMSSTTSTRQAAVKSTVAVADDAAGKAECVMQHTRSDSHTHTLRHIQSESHSHSPRHINKLAPPAGLSVHYEA